MPSKIMELDVRGLCTLLTDDIISGDRSDQISSAASKELKRRGITVIPQVGTYLKSIDKILDEMTDGDDEEIRAGWVDFFVDIVNKHDVNMRVLVTNYCQWVNWACEFRT